MIDVENQVYDRVVKAIRKDFPKCKCQSMTVLAPNHFPFVCLEEADNFAYRATRDSGSTENHAQVMYECNVFSNSPTTAKSECKGILEIVDREMSAMGFTRIAKQPITMRGEPVTYRMVARYRAVVGADETIYRR